MMLTTNFEYFYLKDTLPHRLHKYTTLIFTAYIKVTAESQFFDNTLFQVRNRLFVQNLPPNK